MNWKSLCKTSTLFVVLAVAALAAQPLHAADLSGKWIFSFLTPDGVVDGTLELTQDGETLTAKFDEAKLEGTATAAEFTLAGDYFAPSMGYEAALAIRGKQDGEKLLGDAIWDVHELTFTAVRAN